MAQVAPGIARVELRYAIPENNIENVFYARTTSLGLWSQADMDALEAAFVTWFTTYGSNYMSNELSLTTVLITDLTSLSGIRKTYPIEPPLIGNEGAGYLPANVTFALKAGTGKRGRGTNGRMFWPGLCTSQVSLEQMQKVQADDIVVALGHLVAAIAAVPGCAGLCVPHFVVGGVRPPVVQSDLIVAYTYSDLYLDSQRDRLPFHKKHKRAHPGP